MIPDLPENYINQPAFDFIKNVPVDFDQTIFIDGEIGDYITIARRKVDRWYLGSITDENERFKQISLDFLDANRTYLANVYSDSRQTNWYTNPSKYDIGTYKVTNQDTLLSAISKTGGVAIEFVPFDGNSFDIEDIEVFNSKAVDLFDIFKSIPDQKQYNQVSHLAISKPIKSTYKPSLKFESIDALVDGKKGNPLVFSEKWCGFKDNKMEVIIDLERLKSINEIEIRFLEDQLSWIFKPEEVEILTSSDGIHYNLLFHQKDENVESQKQKRICKYGKQVKNLKCRYIKVIASPLNIIPEWHNGKGNKAWMFVDEIVLK